MRDYGQFKVAKRGDYLLAAITCKVCGNEVVRTGNKGRPAKTCRPCRLEKLTEKVEPQVKFAVNVSDPEEQPNFIQVSGGADEFWNAMAAKALMRRAAREGGETPAADPQA
jgi:hypothetical protein